MLQPQHNVDAYPSRTGGEAAILKREDPVVWGDARNGPLDPEQVEHFDRHGYLFLERLFSPEETESMHRELHRVLEQSRDSTEDRVIREPNSDEVRSVFMIHRTNELFSRVARDRRVLEIIMQLLGGEVYVHHSRINYKPGFYGKEFYWHSDFETWHVEDGMPRPRAISCSLSMTENNKFNGPLMVIPGSHRHYVSCPGETPREHVRQSLRKQEYGVPTPEHLGWLVEQGGLSQSEGPAGSLLLFECNLMHGSNSNISPYSRSNFFIVYNSVENGVVEPFGGQPPRPEFIRSTDFTPLQPL